MHDPILLATGMGIAYAVLAVVSIGLSVASAYLLNPKTPREPLRDEAPSTTATRGVFIPYIIGRRRVGASVAYVGNRTTTKENAGGATKFGGKKSSASRQTIYHEEGWHILCVGPAKKLHAIYESGKNILNQTLTPENTPSGSVIGLGHRGTFRIYWGEEDQSLGAEVNTAIGVNSRWPFICYIYWVIKRLGPAPRWPILDYEVEVPPFNTHLLNSPGTLIASFVTGASLPASLYPWAIPNTPRASVIVIQTIQPLPTVTIGSQLTVVADNDSALNGTYTVFSVAITQHASIGLPTPTSLTTVITVEEPMPQATIGPNAPQDTATVTLPASNDNDGANHAHMIAQILWDSWPQGLGLPKSAFNLDYFEEAGSQIASEGIRGSYRAPEGRTALVVLGHILQDMGALLPWDVDRGKFLLKIVRQESTHPTVPEPLVLEPLPTIRTVHGRFGGSSPKASKVVFEFADRSKSYRAMTLVVDDDGEASRADFALARKVKLPTINDFASAGIVAERRAQEDLSNGAVYSLHLNRETRLLFPGQTLIVSGISPRLRILAKEIDPYSGKVSLEAVTDYYGAVTSTFIWTDLSSQESSIPDSAFSASTPLDEDLETSTGDGFRFYELPGHLAEVKDTTLLVPRIRANAKIPAAAIWLSADGATYRQIGVETSLQTGGELTEAITAGDSYLLETGPTFDALGVDIAQVLDLTGDNANWYSGRQLAVIDDEIFFLRNITALGGVSYRLNGLVRARFDTVRASHAIGQMVRIFTNDSIYAFRDTLIKPGNTIYVKVQPIGGANAIDLSEIRAISQTIEGKGVTPMSPGALRTVNMRSTWTSGDHVALRWGYRSTEFPGTGAGMQGAGKPTGCSAVEGRFLVEMKTTGDVLKQSYMVSDPMLTYYNEDLVADFGSEPSSFNVVLTHVHGGLKSATVTLTLTKE